MVLNVIVLIAIIQIYYAIACYGYAIVENVCLIILKFINALLISSKVRGLIIKSPNKTIALIPVNEI